MKSVCFARAFSPGDLSGAPIRQLSASKPYFLAAIHVNTILDPASSRFPSRLQFLNPRRRGLLRLLAGTAPTPTPLSLSEPPHLIQVHVGSRALWEHLIHSRLHLETADFALTSSQPRRLPAFLRADLDAGGPRLDGTPVSLAAWYLNCLSSSRLGHPITG